MPRRALDLGPPFSALLVPDEPLHSPLNSSIWVTPRPLCLSPDSALQTYYIATAPPSALDSHSYSTTGPKLSAPVCSSTCISCYSQWERLPPPAKPTPLCPSLVCVISHLHRQWLQRPRMVTSKESSSATVGPWAQVTLYAPVSSVNSFNIFQVSITGTYCLIKTGFQSQLLHWPKDKLSKMHSI